MSMSNQIISLTKLAAIAFILAGFSACSGPEITGYDFTAFYTSYGSDDEITGDYADVIIRYPDNKQFVFCRETSYLPFLETKNNKHYVEEIIQRRGDGNGLKLDKYNKYAYVRIIENTPEKILVHWRYIKDLEYSEPSSVVHEYFTFTPDGKVTRVIHPGKHKLDEFNDPGNRYVQELKLSGDGIQVVSSSEPDPVNEPLEPVIGAPVVSEHTAQPDFWWRFDEGLKERNFDQKDITVEEIAGTHCMINGNLSLWKKGVSGTALAFDGYYSSVSMERIELEESAMSFSLEAWVALGAYPWKKGAVIDFTAGDGGIYFGLSDLGQLIFGINGVNRQYELRSEKEIELYTWTHIAATYDNDTRVAKIFIDGNIAGILQLVDDYVNLDKTVLVIGLNKNPERTTQHVSRDYPPDVRTPQGNQPKVYGIEGLIDEVKVYTEVLTPGQVMESYQLLKPSDENGLSADLEPRILPGEVDGNPAEQFGAYYTNLKYHDLWDNLWRPGPWPDIVVRFDELPCNIVYWRGSNYGAGWVTEKNIWMSDQSSEIGTFYGCAEHMADKQNRFAHVRLLENTDARVVIHWRYASADIVYIFKNWRTWTDEYHYIYPDGTAIRHVNYRDGEVGWQDVQFFAQPGTTPEDNIHLQALTVANLEGETFKMDWTHGVPKNELDDASISVVNFKAEYKVIVIYPNGSEIGAWGHRERATPETHFAGPWNHWPVSQMPNDGRYAMRTDRVTHSALGGAGPETMAIYGFTNQEIKTLIPLAKFWNYPPEISLEGGAGNARFEQSQKAYIMEATGEKISMKIAASDDSPLQNPCFVIEDWGKKDFILSLNGKKINSDQDFRYGLVPSPTGFQLVIWLKLYASETTRIEISHTGP